MCNVFHKLHLTLLDLDSYSFLYRLYEMNDLRMGYTIDPREI